MYISILLTEIRWVAREPDYRHHNRRFSDTRGYIASCFELASIFILGPVVPDTFAPGNRFFPGFPSKGNI